MAQIKTKKGQCIIPTKKKLIQMVKQILRKRQQKILKQFQYQNDKKQLKIHYLPGKCNFSGGRFDSDIFLHYQVFSA